MHYYTFSPKDYISKTSFLEPLEDLAYRRMLDYCYLTENPLPESIEEISILISMRSHCDCIATVLRYFFELTPQGYINDRIAREIEKYHAKSSKAKQSARARWDKNTIKDIELANDANALRTECEGNANYKLLTNNYELGNNDEKSEKPEKFSMLKSLVGAGSNSDLAKDWLSVRRTKKLKDTERSLNMFLVQVGKSGYDINTILNLCVVKSWGGFEIDWLRNVNMIDYVVGDNGQTKPEVKIEDMKEVNTAW